MQIRESRPADRRVIFEIINDAARAYRGVIPDDRWREPYMPDDELAGEIAAGVVFWMAEDEGQVLGVMGLQDRGEVALVRHAYVATVHQRKGVGATLLRHAVSATRKPILIGTWAAAGWAIDFYERHGFTRVTGELKDRLLRKYWSIPERQIDTSVVLVDGRWAAMSRNADLMEAENARETGTSARGERTGVKKGRETE